MKKMLINQKQFKNKLYTGQYANGQLAVFVHDCSGEPIAELSIMHNSVDLAPNEFILKEYSENEDLAKELIESEQLISTYRYILIGKHLCPVCKIEC